MSSSHQEALKTRLFQLECHFTWSLNEENIDLTNLLNRLEEQIELELGKERRVVRSYNLFAYVKYLFGDLEDALINLLKSEKLAKLHYEKNYEKVLIVNYGNLAWLHYHKENYTECEKYLRVLEAIEQKLSLESPSGLHPEVLREKGWSFLKISSKFYNGAKECFREALEVEPDDSDLNAGYAIALYRTNSEKTSTVNSQTVSQLRRAIQLNPHDAVLLVLLSIKLSANTKEKLTESHESLRLVEMALKIDPDNPHVIRYVATFCRQQGALDAAIKLLERTLLSTPNSAFIHHQLALCYKGKKKILENERKQSDEDYTGEIEECLTRCIFHLEKAVSLKSSFVIAKTELAFQYGQARDIVKAEVLFQEAFGLAEKQNEHVAKVHHSFGLFQQYFKRDESLAIRHFMEGFRLQREPSEGKLCIDSLSRIARSRAHVNPNDGKAFDIKGYLHEIKGEKEKALECYEKALKYGVYPEERPHNTDTRIWSMSLRGAGKIAGNALLGKAGFDERVSCGDGGLKILEGIISGKVVRIVDIDLSTAEKSLKCEKSVLHPGPHVVLLVFSLQRDQFTEDTKNILEGLEFLGGRLWMHAIVVFTCGEALCGAFIEEFILKGGPMLEWLLEKCNNRYHVLDSKPSDSQVSTLVEKIHGLISEQGIHLVISEISERHSEVSLRMSGVS
ncbi:interferon-induced protein with tetratricopeptide repeats 5 [Chanos chanos]|uniref:Interferon-induced protein with tetratricopeptide repeats 5 n=1 Tax=Chanos chanos TaxID=29144 RepID=A0A6J2WX11_CHACN|nr:interferon-induced protein with tetratricopeptide repeats 5-like [Chanos chanos]